MPLLVRTENDLLREARIFLTENTPITNFSPGSTARALMEVVSRQQAAQMRELNANVLQAFVSRATGEFLDRIGELVGVTRLRSTYASDTSTNNFKFIIDPATGLVASDLARIALDHAIRVGIPRTTLTNTSFVIRAGTGLGGRSGADIYVTTENAVFSGNDTEQFVGVISNGLGSAFNVGAGALTRHSLARNHEDLASIADVILCTNTQPISSGRGLESDEEYRFRITQGALAAAAANETAIRLAVLSVPGVNDVQIRKYARGVGTFNVFIIGDAPIVSQGILGAAQVAVESIQALGMRGLVTAPDYLGIEINVRLKFIASATLNEHREIKDLARQAIIDYVNNIEIGGQFIVNEVIQRVLDVSDKILDLEFERFGIGEYNTKTGKNEKFQPAIITNQQAHWNEKWYTNSKLTKVCD